MRRIAVFDLGGVLVDWNPRHLYRKLFAGDDIAMEQFLATVCTPAWHAQHDAGRPFAETAIPLKARFPALAGKIDAFGSRFDEMIGGTIDGTLDILSQLHARGTPLFALSNWPAETFPAAKRRFEFLSWFRGIVVSGEVGCVKPDPRIYRHLVERFDIDPERAVYIDDVAANVDAAIAQGFAGIQFVDPPALSARLRGAGLL